MFDLSLITERFKRSDGFRLELHLHTAESSACGTVPARDMVRMYKKAGYGGVVVTDHFMSGNTAVDKTLPWEQQVDAFFKGYEEAYDEGLKIGVKVFEGLEYSDFGTDFLVYGLDRDFIKAHPEMMQMGPEEFLPMFRKAGAFLIQAHPFREASYVRQVRYFPQYVDAVEVINIGNLDRRFDDKAREAALKTGKPMTAGSDCHRFGDEFFGAGILLQNEPQSLREVCDIIKTGKNYKIFGG